MSRQQDIKQNLLMIAMYKWVSSEVSSGGYLMKPSDFCARKIKRIGYWFATIVISHNQVYRTSWK